MKLLKVFINSIKRNHFFKIGILFFLIVSSLILIEDNLVKFSTLNKNILNITFNLSLGIFTSIIFYIIMVDYPNKNKSDYIIGNIKCLSFMIFQAYSFEIIYSNYDKFKNKINYNLIKETGVKNNFDFDNFLKNEYFEESVFLFNFIKELDLFSIYDYDVKLFQNLRSLKIHIEELILYKNSKSLEKVWNSILELRDKEFNNKDLEKKLKEITKEVEKKKYEENCIENFINNNINN